MSSWAERTWLITGASSGIGKALAKRVLDVGGRVAVTARDVERIDLDLRGRGIAVPLDLTRPDSIAPALATAIDGVGQIDVLVNNAGYGLLGAIEEASDEERRRQLEANFFGPTWLTTLLLPDLRARGRGVVVNVSSVSGVVGPPGSGYYAASKHALEGWSDSLRSELRPFGVHVMLVEPGGFRTEFFGRSRHRSEAQLGVYEAVDRRRTTEGKREDSVPGDPDRGAAAILAALDHQDPPCRLVLGSQATELIEAELQRRILELEAWREVSAGADFPA